MTIRAFETFHFVFYESIRPILNLFVASSASHIFMCSLQNESCRIVIKLISVPICKSMTMNTVGGAFYCKLTMMDVFMA